MTIKIRPTTPADVHAIAHVGYHAYYPAQLTRWAWPRLDEYPKDYLQHRTLRARQYFITPGAVTLAAVETDENGKEQVWGTAVWVRKGRDEAAREWRRKGYGGGWFDGLNRYLLSWEMWYHRVVENRAMSAERMGEFFRTAAGFPNMGWLEDYWYVDNLAVHPDAQRRGIATQLLQWGFETAAKENVPIMLLSSPEGQKLYLKHGFRTFEMHSVDPSLEPGWAMLWEPEHCKGKWLADGEKEGDLAVLKTVERK